jgi:hypothetical protein
VKTTPLQVLLKEPATSVIGTERTSSHRQFMFVFEGNAEVPLTDGEFRF